MLLSDFEWSRNPRGLHVRGVYVTPMQYERWTEAGFGWVKLVAAELEYLDDAVDFMRMGVTPVVRMYRPRWGARPLDTRQRAENLADQDVGGEWLGDYKETQQPIDCAPGGEINWRNMDLIAPLMDNWLNWAEFIVSQGGYPGFIPLAESDADDAAAVRWMDAFLNYLAARHYDRFRYVLANGCYCATHPYILNHFYQQRPGGGPLSAREPHEQNADEGGWHFEYPYDPICQATDPGRTVYGGTALTPNGDPVGLTAMGRMFNERCAAMFGSQAVPVLGTEGGIWPFLTHDPNQQYFQQDDRYPPYNLDSQAEGTAAMFDWIAQVSQPWFFGVCLWKEDEYYDRGTAPAIVRLRGRPPILREVPPIPVMASGIAGPEAAPPLAPGPGPIHGSADFHILILAPGLDPDWFFDTAQAYWERFRPIVTTYIDLIDFITNQQSLAVTVIATPDVVEAMQARINETQYPYVWYDMIVAQSKEDIAARLQIRVERDQRFGS